MHVAETATESKSSRVDGHKKEGEENLEQAL